MKQYFSESKTLDDLASEIEDNVRKRPHKWWELESLARQYKNGHDLSESEYLEFARKLDALIVACEDGFYRVKIIKDA